MSLGDDYFDYSADDALPQLTATLDYFFSHEKNIYRYGLAYQHFEDLKTNPTTATSKRLFTIVTGTNLVTNQLVLTYRTPQGTRYKIKKSYLQLIDRYKRSTTRAQNRSQQSQNSPSSQSYTEQKQTSTDGNIAATDPMISTTSNPSPKNSTTPTQDNRTPAPPTPGDSSIPKNISEQAAENTYKYNLYVNYIITNVPTIHSSNSDFPRCAI